MWKHIFDCCSNNRQRGTAKNDGTLCVKKGSPSDVKKKIVDSFSTTNSSKYGGDVNDSIEFTETSCDNNEGSRVSNRLRRRKKSNKKRENSESLSANDINKTNNHLNISVNRSNATEEQSGTISNYTQIPALMREDLKIETFIEDPSIIKSCADITDNCKESIFGNMISDHEYSSLEELEYEILKYEKLEESNNENWKVSPCNKYDPMHKESILIPFVECNTLKNTYDMGITQKFKYIQSLDVNKDVIYKYEDDMDLGKIKIKKKIKNLKMSPSEENEKYFLEHERLLNQNDIEYSQEFNGGEYFLSQEEIASSEYQSPIGSSEIMADLSKDIIDHRNADIVGLMRQDSADIVGLMRQDFNNLNIELEKKLIINNSITIPQIIISSIEESGADIVERIIWTEPIQSCREEKCEISMIPPAKIHLCDINNDKQFDKFLGPCSSQNYKYSDRTLEFQISGSDGINLLDEQKRKFDNISSSLMNKKSENELFSNDKKFKFHDSPDSNKLNNHQMKIQFDEVMKELVTSHKSFNMHNYYTKPQNKESFPNAPIYYQNNDLVEEFPLMMYDTNTITALNIKCPELIENIDFVAKDSVLEPRDDIVTEKKIGWWVELKPKFDYFADYKNVTNKRYERIDEDTMSDTGEPCFDTGNNKNSRIHIRSAISAPSSPLLSGEKKGRLLLANFKRDLNLLLIKQGRDHRVPAALVDLYRESLKDIYDSCRKYN
ncbi:unnamed protein product [Gordionus sp. m RMFG-2023]